MARTIEEKITALLLEHGEMTVRGFAKSMRGVEKQAIRNRLTTMMDQGKVKNSLTDGGFPKRYSLTKKGSE